MSELNSARRTGLRFAQFVALSAALAGVLAARAEAPRSEKPMVSAVEGVGITVSNLDRATAFYTNVLTFEMVRTEDRAGEDFARVQRLPAARARTARLRLGDETIELTEYLTPRGRPFPPDSRANDRWFQHIAIVVRDMERAHARLHDWMVRHASTDPQRLPDWNRAAAGIRAFYFRDPDGHFLELIEFPPDKGDPRWHRPTDRLFIGIDHTAIVVADTEASLQLYRDALGMTVAGSSENYGPEQQALNNVPGAHLRITTLRAPAGPGIELLEYLHPRDGRTYPPDAQASDLLHWQTTLVVRDLAALTGKLQRETCRAVSSSAVPPASDRSPAPAPSPAPRSELFRDPDGHALLLIED